MLISFSNYFSNKKIRDKFFNYLRRNNIVNIHYIPIFYHLIIQKKNFIIIQILLNIIIQLYLFLLIMISK